MTSFYTPTDRTPIEVMMDRAQHLEAQATQADEDAARLETTARGYREDAQTSRELAQDMRRAAMVLRSNPEPEPPVVLHVPVPE